MSISFFGSVDMVLENYFREMIIRTEGQERGMSLSSSTFGLLGDPVGRKLDSQPCKNRQKAMKTTGFVAILLSTSLSLE
jgi:hypothetical protein